MRQFVLGLLVGLTLGGASIGIAQLYPNMPPGYRDLQMQQFWQKQQEHNMWERQEREMGGFHKPC